MNTMTVKEFHLALNAQGVKSRKHLALKCPICSTVQTMEDLERAGVAVDKIENYFGFSCVGRFTGAGSWLGKKDKPGRGCDWTLGGLFQLHKLEVTTEDGKVHPTFEPATPEEAQAHEKELENAHG